MQGCFIVYADETDKYGVMCSLNYNYAKETIPEDQQKLYLEVERTNATIKALKYASDDLKLKYFRRLLGIAQAGLVGETAQPELAKKSIAKLKEEMVLIEGPRIKNEYMKRLGATALFLILLLIIGAQLISRFVDKSYTMYFVTFIGALCGTWISYGARQIALKFKNLSLLEEDMMSPAVRLIYMGICSIILLFFLSTDIIKIEIGGVSTESISKSFELQFAIGVLCGLVESKIGSKLYNTAKSVFSEDDDEPVSSGATDNTAQAGNQVGQTQEQIQENDTSLTTDDNASDNTTETNESGKVTKAPTKQKK